MLLHQYNKRTTEQFLASDEFCRGQRVLTSILIGIGVAVAITKLRVRDVSCIRSKALLG